MNAISPTTSLVVQQPTTTTTTITGDNMAGTRVAGYFTWTLATGAPESDVHLSLSQARLAAETLSEQQGATVGILQQADGFHVAPVTLAHTAMKDTGGVTSPFPLTPAAPFRLADAMNLLERGGMGDQPPTTPLIALVDGFRSAHIAVTGSALHGTWGFVPGIAAQSD